MGSGQLQALLQVGTGDDQVATKVCDHPHGQMALDQEDRIVLALRQVEELLAERFTGVQPCLGTMKHKKAPEHPEELWGILHLVAQRMGPGKDVTGLWRGHALGGHEQLPQDELQRQFVPSPLGAVRHCRQQLQPSPQGGDRFGMGIAPGGIVPHLLPIRDGPLHLAPALEVDGQLGCDFPGARAIARLQPCPNAPVELRTAPGSDLFVEDLLVQDMLKPIAPAPHPIRPRCQPGVLDHVVLRRQRFTPGLDLLHGALGARRHHGHLKRLTHHARGLQYLPHLRWEGLDAP